MADSFERHGDILQGKSEMSDSLTDLPFTPATTVTDSDDSEKDLTGYPQAAHKHNYLCSHCHYEYYYEYLAVLVMKQFTACYKARIWHGNPPIFL